LTDSVLKQLHREAFESMNISEQYTEHHIWKFYYRFQKFPTSQKILLPHLFRKAGNRIRLIRAQRAPMILWLIIGRSGISWELDGGEKNKRQGKKGEKQLVR